jgi:hypothetical protein
MAYIQQVTEMFLFLAMVCFILTQIRLAHHLSQFALWGEVPMCYTPPTLITVHFDLVQHFIEGTVLQLVTN